MACATAATVASSCGSISACAISACSSSRARMMSASAIGQAPRGQALVLEGELRDLAAHPRQHLRHPVLALELAVEQHVAASAGTGDLTAERSRLARGRV